MEQTIDDTLLNKLGFDKPVMENKVIPLSIEDFNGRMEKLQNMSSEEFSKILKFDSDKIADFIIKVDDQPSTCENGKNCSFMNVVFEILFQYDINGFKKYSTHKNVKLSRRQQGTEEFINFLSNLTIQRKNAGYFLLTSNYQHHSEYCGSAHQTSVITRSPFSLLIPNYYHLNDRLEENHQAMYELIQTMMSSIPKKISLANHKKFFNNIPPLECIRSHDGDWCDCGDSDCDEIQTAEEYCEKYCKQMNTLDFFFTHPHYFVEMENFCTGSQFTSNQRLKQLEQHPNPISYLAEVIKLASDVYWGDAFKQNEYFLDVFANWHVFNAQQPNYIHKYYQALMYGGRNNKPSEYHTLNNDCFCFDCLQFKRLLSQGLKFDPTKLKFAEFPEKDHSWFKDEFLKDSGIINEQTAIEIYDTITDIDLKDPKYHISNKSKLNFFDSILEERYHFLGMFENGNGGAVAITLDEATEQFKPLLSIKELIESEKDYTTGIHEFMEDLKEHYKDVLTSDNIDIIYNKYSENMLN